MAPTSITFSPRWLKVFVVPYSELYTLMVKVETGASVLKPPEPVQKGTAKDEGNSSAANGKS
jgi:hypothetical protein